MYPLDGLRDVFLETLRDGTFPQHYIGSYEKVLATKWDNALHEFNEHYDIVHKGEWRYANNGKWLLPGEELADRPMAECSCCRWYVDDAWLSEYTYCPNCGAKMGEVTK